MTEPRRFCDAPPSDLAADLLAATRLDAASSRSVGRAALVLGVGASAAAVAAGEAAAAASATATATATITAATASGTVATTALGADSTAAAANVGGAVGTGLLVKWLAIGAVATTALSGGALMLAERDAAPSRQPVPAAKHAESKKPSDGRAELPITVHMPVAEPSHPSGATDSEDPPGRAVTARQPSPRPASPTRRTAVRQERPAHVANEESTAPVPSAAFPEVTPSPSIANEIELVAFARSELAHGRIGSALRALDNYEGRGGGTLRPEAQVIRIEALLQLGERDRALALAEQFISRYPDSTHTPRLRALVGSYRGSSSAKTPER